LRAYLGPVREHLREVSVEGIVSAMATLLPEVDREVLTGEFGEDMRDSFRQAVLVGVDGWLDDDLAFIKPWGFGLDEITTPTTIWQGSEDLMVPFAHGQWLAGNVPGAIVHLEEGEGHLSVGVGAVGTMLDELVSLLD
jgi:pimeloyl-ACP methyl ester carboxylesterase